MIAVSFLGIITVSAQQPHIDSLKAELKRAASDTIRIQILGELAGVLPEGEWEAYNEEMEVMAYEKLKNASGREKEIYLSSLASAYNNKAITAKYTGQLSLALEYSEKALTIFHSLGDTRNECIDLYNSGKLYQDIGNTSKAIDYLQKAYAIAVAKDYKDMQTYSLNILGFVSKEQHEFDKALEYHQTAYKTSLQSDDIETVGFTLSCIGLVYSEQGKYDPAIDAFTRSLETFVKANNQQNVAAQYSNLGTVLQRQKKFDEANEYFQKSLAINTARKDAGAASVALVSIGRNYLSLNDIKNATTYFERSLASARQGGFPRMIYPPAQELYFIYKQKGQSDKALQMYELFVTMRDSVTNEATRRNTIKAQFKYEMDKRLAADSVQRIEEKKVMAAQLAGERIQRYALLAGIMLLVTAAGFIVYRLRTRQRLKELRIRDQIASDLHDDVGSALSSISLFAGVARTSGEPSSSMVEKIEATSRETIENMSDIVWSIQSKNDNISNVVSRMRYFGSDLMGSSGIEFEFNADPCLETLSLDMVERKNLYLIYKEALNNAAKYSRAKKVAVSIIRSGKGIAMKITDDGNGFDTTSSSDGNGLKNMKQRATEIGASFDILTGNAGTVISLQMATKKGPAFARTS